MVQASQWTPQLLEAAAVMVPCREFQLIWGTADGPVCSEGSARSEPFGGGCVVAAGTWFLTSGQGQAPVTCRSRERLSCSLGLRTGTSVGEKEDSESHWPEPLAPSSS